MSAAAWAVIESIGFLVFIFLGDIVDALVEIARSRKGRR